MVAARPHSAPPSRRLTISLPASTCSRVVHLAAVDDWPVA
jgi:hypothetical protein